MTPLRIGAESRAALATGQPWVIAANGVPELPLPVLVPKDGILRLAADASAALPVPDAPRPLALLALDAAAAAALAAGLPEGWRGLPCLVGADPLPALVALLAEALRCAQAAHGAALGLLARQPVPPRRILDVPPHPGSPLPPARISQSLGRPAEGLCGVALHLAEAVAGPDSMVRVRLRAGPLVLGAWLIPGPDLAPGWLELELPDPAPPGPAEAALEVAVEVAGDDRIRLSLAGADPAAALALRAEVAAPGHLALPRHFDWAARGLPALPPAAMLPLAASAWAGAVVEGAIAERIAVGAEPPRLLLTLAPGAEARVSLPALPPGAADLVLAELVCRQGEAEGVRVALLAGGPGQDPRGSPWHAPDEQGGLRIAVPLPAGVQGALLIGLRLRNAGPAPTQLEVVRLALMAGAAGAPRRLPPAWAAVPAAPGRASPVIPPLESRPSVTLPLMAGGEAQPAEWTPPLPGAFRVSTPMAALGEAPPRIAPLPIHGYGAAAHGTGASADFQDFKLHQHTVNADGSYRHVDLGLTGLVAAAGVWRQVRLKLFERRGVVGLEFRSIKGWPPMFDVWPRGGEDQFGPYWRLETNTTAVQLAQLGAPKDRALVAALLDILPGVARRAAKVAALAAEEQEEWAERGRTLARAVEATRTAAASGAEAG